MKAFHKKCCALLVGATVMSSLLPTTTRANTRQAQAPETVYVGFIKDGERSTLFNQDWRFYKGDQAGAESADFNDSSWRALNLPHDWSIEGDFTVQGEAESGFLLGGTGWYRKHFVVPENYEGKDFTINFDGVYMNAEVYVNGKLVGEHNYGYTAFAFDITDELICDGETENVIAVKVKNPIPTSRWYSGSGIYRDVTLTVTEAIHVSHLGTTITTPKVKEQEGKDTDVVVSTVIENESDKDADVKLKTTVLNSNDEAVSTPVESTKNIVANGSFNFEQTAVVNNPALWSVDNPNMYKVKNEVIVNDEVVDTYYTRFGFRYFNFDRDNGFSLNGENMKLMGVSMHHDQGSLGAASYYRAVERQMEIMKEMGANSIRVTHNPASEMLLEICDRLGLLVINEAFDTWTNSKNGNVNDFSKFFNEAIGEENQIINGEPGMTWGEFEARNMVKTSKNNPSVIMWSIGNEVFEGIGGNSSNYATIAQNIIDWVQDEDTTRPVTIGDNRGKYGDSSAVAVSDVVANNGGIVGFNYATDNQFNNMRNKKENWILYGSETSSAVHSRGYYKVRNHNDQSKADLQLPEFDNNFNKVGWGHSASDAWKYTIENDYNAGEYIWTGFDYIGEPTPWNGTGTGTVGGGKGAAPKSSYFGIVDTAGFEKDVYYLYQSQWNHDLNTLHILPTWNKEDIQLDNGNVEVDVFTDAYKVELYVNDKLVGTKTSTENVTPLGYKYYTFDNGALYPTFNVPYEAGTITAKAYDKDGKLIEDTKGRSSITTYGEVSTVELTADKTTIDADGYDLSYITVDLVDENGNKASGANNMLNYTLEGNGKIVGLDNGNAADIDRYKPETDKFGSRSAFSGKALVIVQSTKDAGEMTLTVSGEGLESQSIKINTVNNVGDDKYLESYDIVKDYYVSLGEKPELPKEVAARYNDGTTENIKVNWNEYDENQLNTPQIFNVTGKLENTDTAVVVKVHVVGGIASLENYSTFTYAGTAPSLPKTVKGYLANGEESEEFIVNWNLDGLDFSKENTNVVVPGTAEILGKAYDVKANIRVVPALKAANNLSRSEAVTLSQSPTTPSDSLESIINGVTNGGENTQERWTNWAERNLTNEKGEPKGAYVQFDWENNYSIDRLDLWLFTDNLSARIPKKVEISYKNEAGEYVVAPHTNTTEVSHFAGETTYFLNEVINTNSIRIYMQQPQVGTCIGLSEVNVYEYVQKESLETSNSLTEIKLDGEVLGKFDAAINEYSISVDKLPELVEATASDNAAVTILPISNNKSTIIVTAENGDKNIYTINYILPSNTDVDKTMLEMTVGYAEEVKANGALEGVVPAVVKEFEEALKNAKAVLVNKDATAVEVELASKKLVDAIHMLDFKKGDKAELKKIVEIINALNASEYKPSTWSTLQIELEKANKVIADENAMEAEVKEVYNTLIKAYLDLRLIPNKDALKDLVNKAEAIDKSKYTEESVSALNVELVKVKSVLANDEVTEEEVNKATKALELALNNLELVQVGNGDGNTNNGNTNNETTGNNTNNGANNEGTTGNVTGNSNSNGKGNNTSNLPRTGGTSSVAVGLFGTITSLVGISMMKRKKRY